MTHPAYKINTTTSSTPDAATTEFTSTEYTNVGSSNNVYASVVASAPPRGTRYAHMKFLFNLSAYDLIDWVFVSSEGKYVTTGGGTVYFIFRYYDVVTSLWVTIGSHLTSDNIVSENFTGALVENIVSGSSIATVGLTAYVKARPAYPEDITGYCDELYLTVGYTEEPTGEEKTFTLSATVGVESNVWVGEEKSFSLSSLTNFVGNMLWGKEKLFTFSEIVNALNLAWFGIEKQFSNNVSIIIQGSSWLGIEKLGVVVTIFDVIIIVAQSVVVLEKSLINEGFIIGVLAFVCSFFGILREKEIEVFPLFCFTLCCGALGFAVACDNLFGVGFSVFCLVLAIIALVGKNVGG